MQDVCPNVSVSRGELTAQLRRAWKLETVIPQVRLETKVDPKSDKPDNHLPLFDDDKPAMPITREDFERFRACWENHHGLEVERTDRRIDKRIDHRHHLIDALVIGLTDRSLYMGMARGYKERMEQRAAGVRGIKPWQTPEPPLRNIRELALRLIRDADVTHKTDRYIGGAFFDKMAYAKARTDDGKGRVVRSVDLLDLADKTFALDKTRVGISTIESAETRHIVSTEFERRILSGQDVKSALSSEVVDPRYGTLIRRVRIFQRDGRGYVNGEDAIKVILDGRTHRDNVLTEKYYLSSGYAYIALIKNAVGLLVESVSVRTADAPIFDSSRVGKRIFRDDTVRDEQGNRWLVRQIHANGKIAVAPLTESRTWGSIKKVGGATTFNGKEVLKLSVEP